ncbi:MAG TPA: ABC transporter ATP-binding protein [Methylomirabilota bacterium]|nr:ABC transporter ATP-binding protein [Methylomirabilota bacterium]
MSDPLLAVEDLRVEIPTRRGTVRAVRGVSFRVRPGETFALVGESGSGKTMTCRAIMRLVHPPGHITGGRVLFEGRDLAQLPERELEHVRGHGVVMVFQDPMTALNPVLSVERQITEVLADGGASESRRARAVELLRHVGIPDPARRLDAYPHELSGGQRQRVMLAIALARQPRLLLADEPTTALDVTIQAQILRLLVTLQRELGMALILVTHDLGVVYQSVDRVAVMYAGEVVELATTAELFARPSHPYTIGLIQSIPSIERRGRLVPIPGAPPDLATLGRGCPFAPRCAWASPECRAGNVPLFPVAPDHWSRCLHIDRLPQA